MIRLAFPSGPDDALLSAIARATTAAGGQLLLHHEMIILQDLGDEEPTSVVNVEIILGRGLVPTGKLLFLAELFHLTGGVLDHGVFAQVHLGKAGVGMGELTSSRGVEESRSRGVESRSQVEESSSRVAERRPGVEVRRQGETSSSREAELSSGRVHERQCSRTVENQVDHGKPAKWKQ